MDVMDRTQHVLDAIDGALEDWTVSGDAMRWTPEPPTQTVAPGRALVGGRLYAGQVTMHVAPAGTFPFDRAWRPIVDEQRLDALSQLVADGLASAIGAVERAAEAMGMSVREFADRLAGLRPLVDPRPEPEDPRERALRLRQRRHTGPSRDVTRQRRPRLHVG